MHTTSPRHPTLLTLPGWMSSGPDHWQSRWEALHGVRRVDQSDWVWPRRGDWLARLDDVVQAEPAPVVLIAHSLGCHLVAAWAQASQHTARVNAALLVAPPDTERHDLPPQLHGWRPPVRLRLPFPAWLLASSNDPYCTPGAAASLAQDWGAQCLDVGPLGHVNGDSGLGDWPRGWSLLQRFLAHQTGLRDD